VQADTVIHHVDISWNEFLTGAARTSELMRPQLCTELDDFSLCTLPLSVGNAYLKRIACAE
jgi:hypothetical protein